MNKRVLKFLCLGLILPVMTAGMVSCKSAGSKSVADGEIHLAIVDDIVSMDAHKTSNDYIVPMNVFDSLFSIKKNPDGTTEIVNSLADSYTVSDDGLVYKFTLKDGIVFSDGTPLKADDVKFTFERILTLPDSAQTDFVIAIDGAEELLNGQATELRGITVEDDLHFTITLAEPFSGFIAQLATPSTVIYSRKIVTEAGNDFGTVPEKTIGTGPYIVTAWNRGSGLSFEYNTRYWGEEPSVKKVEIKVMDASSMNMAFQKGDLDILDCLFLDSAIVDSTYKNGAYKDSLVSVDRLGTNYFLLNENIEPLTDVKVRKAIQLSIDRESILQSVYGGDGKLEDGIYPSGCLGYSQANQGWLKRDTQEAKKLLKEAGYENGFDMEISVDAGATDAINNSIQIIAENLKEVGINANIKSYDHASWLDLRNSGKMPSFVALWILDFNDPDNIIYTFFGSVDNTVSRSDNYGDTATIARVADARKIVNTDERMAEYAALEKKLVQDDAVWVPLYSLKHTYVKGSRVKNFTPHWAGWSDIYFSGVELF